MQKNIITIDMNFSSEDLLYDSMFNFHNLHLAEIIDDLKNADKLTKIYEQIEKKSNKRYPELVLKSSPIPIVFVPFNKNDQNCFNCGDEYIEAPFYRQKYCKKC